MRNKFIIIFLTLIIIPLVAFSIYSSKISQNDNSTDLNEESASSTLISFANEIIWNDSKSLKDHVLNYGPKKTVEALSALSSQFGSCHQNAHLAGRFAYEIFDANAFQNCGAECHSGCYHGATEAYFKKNGTEKLEQKLGLICNSNLNSFFSHQCIHGIGHGLMAFTNYDLPQALKDCDLLPSGQSSCYTGVFMENIVGALAIEDVNTEAAKEIDHFSKYLNKDPLFPCNIVEEKYRDSCYFLQTSRMIQIYGTDFKRIAETCGSVPTINQRSCYGSMGRDVGGSFAHNPEAAILNCNFASYGEPRNECIKGAVQDSLWDPSGQNEAIKFCTLLTDSVEKTECYQTIFSRVPEIISDKTERMNFCKKAESNFQDMCATITK